MIESQSSRASGTKADHAFDSVTGYRVSHVATFVSLGRPGGPHSPFPDPGCQKDPGHRDTIFSTHATVSETALCLLLWGKARVFQHRGSV